MLRVTQLVGRRAGVQAPAHLIAKPKAACDLSHTIQDARRVGVACGLGSQPSASPGVTAPLTPPTA